MNTKTLKDELLKINDFNDEEITEIQENIKNNKIDFEIANYRFIHQDNIDEIMKDELLNDKYVLGCCTSWFIQEITDLDHDIIKKAQKNESFELLGELLAKNIDEVQEKMVNYDGYGHHFNHYDGNEYEIKNYYVFRIN